MPDTPRFTPLADDPPRAEACNAGRSLMVSADELAREFGVSTRTVRRLDLEGKLPAPVRIGPSAGTR